MYTMTGINALSTGAWEGTIRRMGKKVGKVSNAGNGGCHEFHFTTRDFREEFKNHADGWNSVRPAPSKYEAMDMFALWLSVQAEGMSADEFESEMAA